MDFFFSAQLVKSSLCLGCVSLKTGIVPTGKRYKPRSLFSFDHCSVLLPILLYVQTLVEFTEAWSAARRLFPTSGMPFCAADFFNSKGRPSHPAAV